MSEEGRDGRWEHDSGQKSGYKIAPSGAPGNVISAHWWEADGGAAGLCFATKSGQVKLAVST